MAGLLQDTIQANNSVSPTKNVYAGDTTPYDATLRAVDPATETVSGQLKSILDKSNPYVEKARSDALEGANARGLLNSSIAQGEGEKAAIGAALPIAAADANTYSTAAQQNQGYTNSAGQFNSAAQNTSSLQLADAANKAALSSQETGEQVQLQQMKGEQATTLAQIESNYKQLMQANASAGAFFNETTQQLATILRDPNTSAEQKQSAQAAVSQTLRSGLTVIGAISNLDLAGLLNF